MASCVGPVKAPTWYVRGSTGMVALGMVVGPRPAGKLPNVWPMPCPAEGGAIEPGCPGIRNPDGTGENPEGGPLVKAALECKAPPSPPGKTPPRDGNVGTAGRDAFIGEGILTPSGSDGLDGIGGESPRGLPAGG